MKILHLYYDIMNLYGEYANVSALERIIENSGENAEIDRRLEQRAHSYSSTPHCPTCNSTNIRKIGAGERAASIIGLGLFSRKINKTWKCNDCGHTW